MKVQYTRVYSDDDGESHFGRGEMEIKAVDFAPPAPPLEITAFTAVKRLAFMLIRADWLGSWHPAPRRQFLLLLSGRISCEVSGDGKRRFGQGGIILLEDTSGKGHVIRSLGVDSLIGVVQLGQG